MTPWTATDVAPVSPLVISAEIVADGASSIRVIRPWTSAWSTAATVPRGALRVVPTGRPRRSSRDVTLSGSTRMTMSTGSASSNWTRPMGCGVRALRTSPPIWAAVEPTPMALVASTRTWISGEALTRSLDRFVRPGSSSSAARTASDVSATTSASSALMMRLRLLELKPPCWPTVTS